MIHLAPYDPAWPQMFEDEAKSIREVFGAHALRIEHVGSTSVPGLAAKPVIDIQVSVDSLAHIAEYRPLLSALGYVHVDLGPFDLVYPFFQKPQAWPSTHHVHLCAAHSEQESNHLRFRDYLRSNPSAVSEYLALKRALAAKYDGTTIESRECYSLSKGDFIAHALSVAPAWKTSSTHTHQIGAPVNSGP